MYTKVNNPSGPSNTKSLLYNKAYPAIKFHREHGRMITLVLFVLCFVLFGTWLNSTHNLSSTLQEESTKRMEAEKELHDTIERVKALEAKSLEKTQQVEKLTTITGVAKQKENYPHYENEEADESEVDVIEESDYMKQKNLELDHETPPEKLCPGGKLNPDLFSDPEAYIKSPFWKIPRTQLSSYAGMFWATKVSEQAYAKNPPRMHVPHLNVTISQRAFLECFMNPGLPVILKMDRLRPLGYRTKHYTLEGMMAEYPTTTKSLRKTKYRANGLHQGTPDLGPGLAALAQDAKKKKLGAFRNYPRNMKLTRKAVADLGIDFPPYHNPRNRWQLSTMFMGATSADTPMHCDCCDNFCQHIVGTKRWILSPPTESRYLKAKCFGGLCWAKSALPMHPTLPKSSFSKAEQDVLETATYVSVDVHAGEILYLPAGWYHAVYNLNPTVTLINWVASGPSQLYVNQTGLTGGQTARKNNPCLPGMDKC